MNETVFFDARYVRVDHPDGISRFSVGLLTALAKKTKVIAIISDLRQLDKLPANIGFVKITGPTSIFEPFVALKLNKLGAKIVFTPMQTMGSFGRKFKLVLTVHDLIYYQHPSAPHNFSWPIRIIWRLYHTVFWPQRFLLNRADAVVAVSQTTKSLIEKHRLTKKPIWVVGNAPDDHNNLVEQNHAEVSDSEPKSLIYMGSFMDYKNVEVLIQGMEHLDGYVLSLLSKISPRRMRELKALVPKGASVNFLNGVSEDDYRELLLKSFALVSGSKDEGFGIPLVEAMSCGLPVVVSDIPIFREIGESAAVYFDANSPFEFAQAIRSLEQPGIWKKMSEDSKIQSSKFDWEKSSIALIKALKSL